MMWQPIETAPKDGTPILIAPHLMKASWDFGADDWLLFCVPLSEDGSVHGDWSQPWTMWREVMASDLGAEPTHWMPFPEPPTP